MIRYFQFAFLFLFVLFAGEKAFANEPSEVLNSSAALRIQSLLQPYGEKAAFSLKTLEGKSLLEINSKKSYVPASIAKLVSSACTLDYLGSDFQFETSWGYRGHIENGVLIGDLVVQGRGDFSFIIEDLKMIVEYIRFAYGIREIRGKLVFDTSYLVQPAIQAFDGFEGDRGRAFQSMITAAPINHNAFSVWVIPDQPQPRIEMFPKGTIDLKVENKLSLASGRLGGSQTNLDFRPESMKLILSGKVGKEDPVKIYYRALPDPYDAFASLFESNFVQLGGKWKRDWTIGAQSGKITPIWIHRSRSISRLLIDVNKLSTNFGAEMALWAAAAKALGTPVGPQRASEFLQSCIQKFGLSLEEMQLEKSSGLSRTSRFQPEAMSRFLASLKDKAYFPEYLSTLSVLGQDGTTRSRLKPLSAKARLKTGTLSDVRSLAGYVFPPNQMPRTMALVLNCKNCDFSQWQKVEDQILQIIIQNP